MAALPLVAIILLSVLGVVLIEAFFGFLIMFYGILRKKKNPINFIILELRKDSIVGRVEIGRKKFDVNKGWRYVTTTKFGMLSVRDDLGSHISDDHIYKSKYGSNRDFCIVVIKDGIPAPVKLNRKKSGLGLSEEELDLIVKLQKTRVVSIPVEQVDETLSLVPVKYEALRFALDTNQDRQEMYKKPMDGLQRLAAIAGVAILIIAVLGVIVILVLMVTLAPKFAAEYAKGVGVNAPAPPVQDNTDKGVFAGILEG